MFIHTTLVLIFIPKIIEARHNHDQHIRLFKQMSVGIVLEIGAMAFFLSLLIRPFLAIVGKDAFIANLGTFYVLLVAYVLFGLSSIAHYFLYVNHMERFIFYSSIICCAVNLVLNYFLIPNHGVKGAAIALAGSMFVLFALKALWSRSSWSDDCAQAQIGLQPQS
jgi:O-antigen/teichoic acid export membrane protein